MTMMLSDEVQVRRRFQRSVRIDMDLGALDALQGFICHGSGKAALETMVRLSADSNQRAFTWTGPYGGGKSSLALALASALGKDKAMRRLARRQLKGVPLGSAFPVREEGWLVVPVAGRRSDPSADIREALANAVAAHPGPARTRRRKADRSGRDVIERLVAEAEKRPDNGVLLIVDEMGKYLEDARANDADIHFFQNLAEAAGRASGRLLVVGILHQSFEQYASSLGREAQEEWAKVQGRYADIPIIAAIDEVVHLLGRAIETRNGPPESLPAARKVAHSVRRRRPGSPADLENRLLDCWPLHPVTAMMLGPISRRRFGQNERSVFGFLGASEPEGFQEFLRSTPSGPADMYDPARLWDYLRINFEPAILASTDGHRWAQALEAVERSEARGTAIHVQLTKTIALIDLFGNGSGLMPERSLLGASLGGISAAKLDRALADLEAWSVVLFRKHVDAWTPFAGSDFDIAEAVAEAKASSNGLDSSRLARLAGLQPISAKRHYWRTGTLRWFDTDLVELDDARKFLGAYRLQGGADGLLLLVLPRSEEPDNRVMTKYRSASRLETGFPVAIGLPSNARLIRELGDELLALEQVSKNRAELEGDSVARREVRARIAGIGARLEEELRNALHRAAWYVEGRARMGRQDRFLSRLVSKLADATYSRAPIVKSELVNREKPSSNSQAAVRLLLYRMASHPSSEFLGIKGFPAERGLYSTILSASGLHGRLANGTFGFQPPDLGHAVGRSFIPMWNSAEDILAKADAPVPLGRLYGKWAAAPFGVRRGLLPILAMAFIQAHRSSVAIYLEEVFQPKVTELVVDRLLQEEDAIRIRAVSLDGENERVLQDLVRYFSPRSKGVLRAEPLEVARALVQFAFRLPTWARRTRSVSREAESVRRILLNASDPHRTLFVDLPLAYDGVPAEELGKKIVGALEELDEAYPRMLKDLRGRMLRALGVRNGSLKELKRRAQTVRGISGDLRLDALATRLADLTQNYTDMEAIGSLSVNKPAREWSDADAARSAVALAELALSFRRVEALARVKDRRPTQHAFAVVLGTGEEGRTLMKSLTVSDTDHPDVSRLASEVGVLLRESGLDFELALAALAEAGAAAIEQKTTPKTDRKKVEAS